MLTAESLTEGEVPARGTAGVSVVYLGGTAPTPTAREKVADLATAVRGVPRVNNALVVRPP